MSTRKPVSANRFDVGISLRPSANPAVPDIESWCWARQVIESLLALKDLADGSPTPVAPDSLAHRRQLIVHAAHIGVTDSRPGKEKWETNTGRWHGDLSAG